MLRRYSSRGLDGVLVQRKTTIGTAANCDLRLSGHGVAPLHATIEFHPLTRSYWLRDHSLTSTTAVNGHPIVGQAELSDGDLVSFGDSQPLVFQNDSLVHIEYSANGIEKRRQSSEFLPVLGKRIVPQSANIRIVSAGKQRRILRSESADAGVARRKSIVKAAVHDHGHPVNGHALKENNSSSSASAVLRSSPSRTSSTGNALLQRVVRLQGEVARRDEEMRLLRGNPNGGTRGPRTESRHGVEAALLRARRENERLREMLRSAETNSGLPPVPFLPSSSPEASTPPTPDASLEYTIYRAFIASTAAELRRFSDKALASKTRDYSEIFAVFAREMDDPFSIKMLEVESAVECRLSSAGYDPSTCGVSQIFRNVDNEDGIAALSMPIDALWPIVRDAMTIARDSVRSCAIFTAWSRKLGDHMRTSGLSSDKLLLACDELKAACVEGRLASHWLCPSLTPLLRTAAVEMKKAEDKQTATAARRKRSVQQEEINLEVLAEIQGTLDEEKKKNEILVFKQTEMQSEVEQWRKEVAESVKKAEEMKGRLEEKEERIRSLEEELRRTREEKDQLEAEIADEAQKIHDNVTQSVQKLRKKRSTPFDAQRESFESDTMSVMTPLVVARPLQLPSPILSLTDTENISHNVDVDSARKDAMTPSEGAIGEKEEEGRGEQVEPHEEMMHSETPEPKGYVEEKKLDDVEEEDEEGDETEEEEEEAETEEEEDHGLEEDKNEEINDLMDVVDNAMEEEGEETREEEEEKEMDEIKEPARPPDLPPLATEEDELKQIEKETAEMHEIREKVQKRLAPGSTFHVLLPSQPDTRDVHQKIYDGYTEFRRTANFILGLLGEEALSVVDDSASPLEQREERTRILSEVRALAEEEEGVPDENSSWVKREEELARRRLAQRGATLDSRLSADLSLDSGGPVVVPPPPLVPSIAPKPLSSLLDDFPAPPNINQVGYSSHVQSHMNASTRPTTAPRASAQVLPMKVVHFKPPTSSPVNQRKFPENNMRQPRFKF